MTSRWLTFSLTLIFFGSAVLCASLIYDIRHKQTELAEMTEKLTSAQQDARHWLGEYQKLKTALHQNEGDSQAQLSALHDQISNDQKKIEPLKSKMDQLRTKTDGMSILEINAHIKTAEDLLKNLNETLKHAQDQIKLGEGQAKNQVQLTQNEKIFQDSSMNQQLKNLNDSLKFAHSQFTYWQHQKLSPERNIKTQGFQTEEQQINQQINELKKRRSNIDVQASGQEQDVKNQAQADKQNLQLSVIDIQNQIKNQNTDLKHWKDMLALSQKNQTDKNQEMQKLQTEFSQQQEMLKAKQQEAKEKSDSLHQLQQNEK